MPSTVMTEISDFQQPCNLLRFEWVLVGPDKSYPYAEGILLDFRFCCNYWNNSDLQISICSTIHIKLRGRGEILI